MKYSARYVLVLLLVLAACAVSLIFCIDFGKSSGEAGKPGKYAPIFSGKQFTENELIQIELAFADAKLSDYVISDGSVQVPRRQKTVFLQALKKVDFLTSEFSEKSGSSGGLFVSEKEREAAALREKQAALAAQIRTFHGIESARILLDVSETKTGFTREKHASAAVSIRSRAGYAVSQDDIQSILRLVTCSVCNLNAANVTIVDTRTNQSWRFDAPKIEVLPDAPTENAPRPTDSANSNQTRKIVLQPEPLPQPELWNSSSREILQVATDESLFAAPSASSASLGQISLASHSEATKTVKAPETLPELEDGVIPVFPSGLGKIKLPEVQTSANHSHKIPMILGILAAPVILICIWIIYATRKGLFHSERKRLAVQNKKPQKTEEKPVETARPVSQADLMAALVSEISEEAEEESNLTAERAPQAEPKVEPEPAAPVPEPEPEPQRVVPAELAALEQTAPERLALAFLEERPQTAAMLLAQMKPETSAAVLEHIPTKLREGIESRMTGSQAPDEEILRKAAQMILEHLDELDGVPAEEDDFLETVGAILKSDETKKPHAPEKPVIRPLAEAIPKERVLRRFEDLKSCSDSELRGILSETPVQDVNLALLGAEPELVDRVLNVLPKPAAKELQFQLTHPGKVKLMEVEEARQRMLEHAGV